MKTLKESLLDGFDKQVKELKRQQIKEWIEKYNRFKSKYEINNDMTIDIEGFTYDGHHDFPEYIQFHKCYGDFDCSANGMSTLRGCPEDIWGDFNCGWNGIETLKYGPKTVKGLYQCNNCGLKSLKYCPKEVNDINCSSNQLESLKYGPEIVKGDYICYDNKLKTLKDSPDTIQGVFDCSINNLKKYDGPRDVYELNVKRNHLDADAIQWIRENVKYGTLLA